MSYSQYMDIANAVMWESIKNTNYNSHNTSKEYKPVAFNFTSYADRAPETYVYPYADTFNPFVMIEGSYESFTSFVYKLINPETYHPSMLLTPDPGTNTFKITNYEAMQTFLSSHPAMSIDPEHSYGVIINEKA